MRLALNMIKKFLKGSGNGEFMFLCVLLMCRLKFGNCVAELGPCTWAPSTQWTWVKYFQELPGVKSDAGWMELRWRDHRQWVGERVSEEPSVQEGGSWIFSSQGSPTGYCQLIFLMEYICFCQLVSFFFHVGGKEVNSFSSSEHRHSPEIDVTQVIEPGSSTAYWIGKVFNRWLIFISCMLSFLGFFSESNLNFMLRECLALTHEHMVQEGIFFLLVFNS